jgi:hypothetical protein
VTVGDLYANVAENVTAGGFTANSLLGSPSSYAAQIHWGDGTSDTTATGAVKVTGSQGNFSVASKHTYAATGAYTVQVTVADASGTTTVAYDKIQAVTAPATGYDGEVATTVGTASDATDAMAADPGGQGANSEIVEEQETEAPGSPGEYAYLIPILSAAGALVTAAIPKVEAAPAKPFAIIGPAVVPGNSAYKYDITFPPIKASDINPAWDVQVSSLATGKADARTNADGDWVGITVTVIFPNKPDTVTITLKNLLKGQGKPNKDTIISSFTVHVVQVVVTSPPKAKAFDPSQAWAAKAQDAPLAYGGTVPIGAVEGTAPTATINGKTGQTVAVQIILTQTKAPALAWQAEVTLNGPDGNKYLDQIKVGFHQTVTIVHDRGKDATPGEKSSMEGSTYLDVDPKIGERPWYSIKPSTYTADIPAIFTGAAKPTVIAANDSPRPLPILFWTQGKFYATDVEVSDNFNLSVAAATTDTGFDKHLFAGATAAWSLNADGTVQLNGNSSGSIWTPGTKAGVKAPDAWNTVVPLPKDDTGLLTTGDLANDAAKTRTWKAV